MTFRLYFVFLLLVVGGDELKTLEKRNADEYDCQGVHLEILVSPLAEKGSIRRLEIQWENAPKTEGDWIGLFGTDPLASSSQEELPTPLETFPVTSVHGWTNTSILEAHVKAEDLGFNGKCLNYYAGYFNATNDTLAVTCLRIEPTWMWNLKNEIGRRQIRNVFIPGTHDSSAYGEYNEKTGETRLNKYTITQDESILGQLIYGARYIDLRVGHYSSDNMTWWGNHGIVKVHPLKTIFKDIRQFLRKTNEIVILDLQEFPVGFKTKEIHYKLANFLQKELGYLAAPNTLGWDTTFDEIWKRGKHLIIGYDDREMVSKYDFLWPPVQHKWGNVQTVENLHRYLADVLERPPYSVWSAMAELTPTALDVILNRLKGLRVMAESVNHNVTEWYRRKNWRLQTNVVSVDFFRNTGVVRSAIEWNKNKGKCNS